MDSPPRVSLAQILDILPGVTVHREDRIRCLATTNPQSAPSGCSNMISNISHNTTINILRIAWNRLSHGGIMYDLLDMMAPLFLCDNHQHQADHLANLWKSIFTQAFGSGALNLSMPAGVVPPLEGHSSASTFVAPPVVAVCVVPLPPSGYYSPSPSIF